MAEGNPRDPAVIIARCMMEGHTHACGQCGWTGMAHELEVVVTRYFRKPTLRANAKPTPMRACPNCYYEDELGNFAVLDPDDIIGLD